MPQSNYAQVAQLLSPDALEPARHSWREAHLLQRRPRVPQQRHPTHSSRIARSSAQLQKFSRVLPSYSSLPEFLLSPPPQCPMPGPNLMHRWPETTAL